MSEKIKLRVPAEPAAEYVEHGNFKATLDPGTTIEVEDRAFADWLVSEYALEDLTPAAEPAGEPDVNPLEAEYPADFPDRALLIGNQIPIETARGLDRDQLIALPYIGKKKADAILEYFAAEGGNE